MPMRVVHCCAVKFAARRGWMLVSRRHRSFITLSVVQSVIDVTMEASRTVEPWTCADENAAREPLGTVISIRSAVIGRSFVIAIGANRRSADLHRNLSWRTRTRGEKQAHNNRQQSNVLQCSHYFTSQPWRGCEGDLVVPSRPRYGIWRQIRIESNTSRFIPGRKRQCAFAGQPSK